MYLNYPQQVAFPFLQQLMFLFSLAAFRNIVFPFILRKLYVIINAYYKEVFVKNKDTIRQQHIKGDILL